MFHGPSFAEESYFLRLNSELSRRLKLTVDAQKSKGDASAQVSIVIAPGVGVDTPASKGKLS